jgi:hypothetical protein
MEAYLINKNLCFYYWLKKRIGKKTALRLAKDIERAINFTVSFIPWARIGINNEPYGARYY